MNRTSPRRLLLAALLRLALVVALFAAGWSVYRQLPQSLPPALGDTERRHETRVHIILQRTVNQSVLKTQIPVQLYSINVAAAQREFIAERPKGTRLEEFITRKMRGRPIIEGRLDERGETTVNASPGTWWIHATLPGPEEITWRLRVNVAGREQTIELTPENAYTRAKNF